MAHRSLTLFVICIGITFLLNISHHVYGSSMSFAKSTIDSPVRKEDESLENSMDDPNLITSRRFESSLEHFFEKMEILSAHIDRLHERYMRLNVLDDDYISREFSVESPLKDDNVD